MSEVNRTVDAIWRIESAKVIATLTRMTGDLDFAEDLAQEAVLAALDQWPEAGIPRNPGAWLTTVAKRKAIDQWRRNERQDERYRVLADDLRRPPDPDWEAIDDDVLRLIFTVCHPALATESQVALTLKTVGGLSSEEIARLFVVSVPTIQQRLVRAKRTLARNRVGFESPDPSEWQHRVAGVLNVIYLIFTEGYSATSGDRMIRKELADEALRLGRMYAALMPREAEGQALVALMEFQASRFAARAGPDGAPVLLEDQDRALWDHAQIKRGDRALARADSLSPRRGHYALQAAIAQCHAHAADVESTDWQRIVSLYSDLERLGPNPVVTLNRAVAVSMASGPAAGLEIVDRLAAEGQLRNSYLIPSVRGELLARSGRNEEAQREFATAAEMVANDAQRALFLAKAASAESRSDDHR